MKLKACINTTNKMKDPFRTKKAVKFTIALSEGGDSDEDDRRMDDFGSELGKNAIESNKNQTIFVVSVTDEVLEH